ncbi:hypothetical protein FOY91_15665 [Sphingomonas solaris]|uniref:Uncharacterized protein n=2 Tax=Alterirhizorhabdus solaris TaxID=2529389 RepID=A0A558QY00_9SPHN|nr:hypothetical protein FOY91_15665 [Sphingomonas solaris]
MIVAFGFCGYMLRRQRGAQARETVCEPIS